MRSAAAAESVEILAQMQADETQHVVQVPPWRWLRARLLHLLWVRLELWAARHSQGAAQPLDAQPKLRVLERDASKVPDFTTFDHSGSGLRLRTADARRRLRGAGVAHAPCSRPGCTTLDGAAHDGTALDGIARARAAPLHDVSLLLLTTRR